METKRPQPKYVRLQSLNEVERKLNVDKLNFENSLMLHRLKHVPSVINVQSMEEDFKRHLAAESHLRKRQMKPMALPKDLHRVNDKSSLFDSSTYSAQHENYSQVTNENSASLGGSSPIKSMSDFRKHVIGAKKTAGHGNGGESQGHATGKTVLHNHSMMSDASANRDDSLFEISHVPSTR
jgi:hypothetical protein